MNQATEKSNKRRRLEEVESNGIFWVTYWQRDLIADVKVVIPSRAAGDARHSWRQFLQFCRSMF